MKKPLYKKPLFWVIIVVLLLAIPSLVQIFNIYIYSPTPKSEDFYVREDKLPWDPQALPTKDVEKQYSEDGTRVYLFHYKDGYKLDLPSELGVSTWELQPEQVTISEKFNDETDCFAFTYRLDNEKTAQESFENFEKEFETEEYKIAYTLVRHELEKIEDPDINKEAYIEHYEEEMFGYQPNILIQGDGALYGISQDGARYPECDLMMRVLKGFSFINE
ncbi:hypothetical protein KKF73_00525 [Patescibacteria group bacterium]|nr:hypothetical protein [Patescibacteria group bacterium]